MALDGVLACFANPDKWFMGVVVTDGAGSARKFGSRRGTTQDLTNYRTHGPDGRPIRSLTLFLRDSDGVAVGCLCVNSLDVSGPSDGDGEPETFPPDVDSLQRFLVDRAVGKAGIPVDLMKKIHKAAVVRELEEAGFFLIKDAVDHLAGRLDVTRYTIYNYLNEIRG